MVTSVSQSWYSFYSGLMHLHKHLEELGLLYVEGKVANSDQ